MLKKFSSSSQRVWDEYLPYLLFAYREVPQESTGFSPFNQLYGRKVRRPLDVLREEWTGEHRAKEPIQQQLLEIHSRMRAMTELVQENLKKAQEKQTVYYDKDTKARVLQVGEEVLVLLSRAGNPHKLEWAGPYKVIQQISPVNYKSAPMADGRLIR